MPQADHRPQVAALRRERMRARLLEAALELAAAQGMEAVTIDAVIARAGVARGTFYKYFDSPGALVQALGSEVAEALIRAMHPFIDPLGDPAERLAIGIRTTLRLVRLHPQLGAFMARAGWPAMVGSHAFFKLVGANVGQGIRLGRFAPMHLDVALSALAGILVGAMHAISTRKLPGDFPEQAAAAVLRSVGLPNDEAEVMARAPLAMPALNAATLIGQIMGR